MRTALGLDASNFFLLGHSWGGILAIEYALRYQRHLKGLVISNMMASIPAYNEYAQRVLMPAMDPAALREIKQLEAAQDYENPRYMELLMQHHYVHHVLRRPAGRMAGPGQPGHQAHQSQGLHSDAGAERARRERQAAALGPHRRPAAHHRARR